MKYVITGGAGHISTPLAEQLLSAGHDVTIVGRSAEKLQSLVNKGAKAAVGSVEDAAFVKTTFAGADAVYAMIPPNFVTDNFRHYQNTVARNYTDAIVSNGIKNVVVLSSIGAHMRNGAGPVDGLADFEDLLQKHSGINVKFLRPSYFMYNLFAMIPLIKGMNIVGSNFGGGDEKIILVHTSDIAAAAAEELLSLNFSGFSVRYIASDEKTGAEIATALGNAVDKPGIPWVVFSDEQSLDGMKQAGLTETMAEGYTTMGRALREGKMQEDYWKNHPVLGKVKLEDFVKEFAGAFNA
ncbi:NAD(P)H-binding protein [Ferruginibacter sp. SUN106]|uniref:NAD(P)H-binding protein n=1 Tax=Ferruginibacter sp. SUN106 TaxID=2978348 RepID=UPI003D36270A